MARRTRCSDAGYVYHVLNRAVGRATLFAKSADYAAFEKVLRQAWEQVNGPLQQTYDTAPGALIELTRVVDWLSQNRLHFRVGAGETFRPASAQPLFVALDDGDGTMH